MLITLCIHLTYSMDQNTRDIVFSDKRINDYGVLSSVRLYGKEIARAYYIFAHLRTTSGEKVDNALLIDAFETTEPFNFTSSKLNEKAQQRLIGITRCFIENICIRAFTLHGKDNIIIRLPLHQSASKVFLEQMGFTDNGVHEVNHNWLTYLSMRKPPAVEKNVRIYNAVDEWRWKQFLNGDVVELDGEHDYDPKQISQLS
jgi:hypothetical protein